MTDKQIIIDGVNVAGCEFAVKPINDNTIKCHCVKGLLQIAKMYEQPESIKGGLCENNPNCYYKNYKRKEQICEKLIDKYKNVCKACPKNIKCNECSVKDTLDMFKGKITNER